MNSPKNIWQVSLKKIFSRILNSPKFLKRLESYEVGLAGEYRDASSNLRFFIACFKSLAFFPADLVVETYGNLLEFWRLEYSALVLADLKITLNTSRETSCEMFRCEISSELWRINNIVEGWNSGVNKLVGASHPSVALLVAVQYGLQQVERLLIKLFG